MTAMCIYGQQTRIIIEEKIFEYSWSIVGDAIVSLLFRFIRHKDVCRAGPVFVFAWPDDINTSWQDFDS